MYKKIMYTFVFKKLLLQRTKQSVFNDKIAS